MTITATITSKRQLTIPVKMYEKLNLTKGERVIVEDMEDGLMIRKAKEVIKKLSGSVNIPKNLQKIDIDQAITQAKKARFSGKS